MASGPIGSCWHTGSWSATAWAANSWKNAVVPQTSTILGGGGRRIPWSEVLGTKEPNVYVALSDDEMTALFPGATPDEGLALALLLHLADT